MQTHQNHTIKFLLVVLIIALGFTFQVKAQVKLTSTAVVSVGVDTAVTSLQMTLSNPSITILELGICASYNPIPTIDDRRFRANQNLTDQKILLHHLKPNQIYFIRPYAISSAGVVYGAQRTFATDTIAMGREYYGGQLFYVFQPGDPGYVKDEFHGLVYTSAPKQIPWSPIGLDSLIGGLDSIMGTGPGNTAKIVAVYGPGNYAARYCDSLVRGGYDDWYLPPFDELELMRQSVTWCSTEHDKLYAYTRQSAKKVITLKSKSRTVKPVRKF